MENTPPADHVEFRNIRKVYGGNEALSNVSISIKQGELLSLLGPSGCGKTTLLRILSGFASPTEGDILVDGQRLNAIPPNKRNVGMVFQNYSLFPHMTVYENVTFGLQMRKLDANTIKKRAMEALDLVHLADLCDNYPSWLSGGMQQRVALARVLAIQPRVLLLDEPFGALDRRLKDEMQVEVRKLQQMLKITTLFVTHDQREALTISDRIAVMNYGNIEQEGQPVEIYDRPQTKFVADFFGIPNLISAGLIDQQSTQATVEIEGGIKFCVPIQEPIIKKTGVTIAIRAESIRLYEKGNQPVKTITASPNESLALPGVITFLSNLGSLVTYEIKLQNGLQLIAEIPRMDRSATFHQDDEIIVDFKGQNCVLMER